MDLRKKIITIFLFAAAMAYLESAIVVYLRALYYPGGFSFPMIAIPPQIAAIEIGREVATIAMLWSFALLIGSSFKERFSYFCLSFAIWDIFYYIWLKVFLGWPAAWLDWDILFLIPLPWIAPWLAPVLVSLALVACSIIVLLHPERFPTKIFNKTGWWFVVVGGSLILASFFFQTQLVLAGGIPNIYPWWLFITGLLLGIGLFLKEFIQ